MLCYGLENVVVRIKQQYLVMYFYDVLCGDIQVDLQLVSEDFIIYCCDGLFVYNLVVVVDDYFQGVMEIVCGVDLIEFIV